MMRNRALNEIMDKAETLSRRSPLRRFFQGNNDADQLKDLQKGILIIRQDFQVFTTRLYAA